MKFRYILSGILCFLSLSLQAENEAKEAHYYWGPSKVAYPSASRWVKELSPYSDTVQLDDGSIWNIDPADQKTLFSWQPSDLIFITQNSGVTSWFSKYYYKIINKANNTSVAANMSLGPILGGPQTHTAISVDPIRGYLVLDDNTRWSISYSDYATFSKWLPKETIMIGINTLWVGPDFLLIDVESNSSVTATPIP